MDDFNIESDNDKCSIKTTYQHIGPVLKDNNVKIVVFVYVVNCKSLYIFLK